MLILYSDLNPRCLLRGDSCHNRCIGINKIYILNPTVVAELLQYSGLGSNTGMSFLCTNDLQ